jgi:hypothetical protein
VSNFSYVCNKLENSNEVDDFLEEYELSWSDKSSQENKTSPGSSVNRRAIAEVELHSETNWVQH